ncbi:MAG: tetratricopeptide repeat protein [Elusimicrobia bacterium]|nr:tetratricopeptide repeat protein [Elusimicrobiota bacterium]MDE2426801.1 tetratricopeptide repeat protein [Elusimicrobiota bacterium]
MRLLLPLLAVLALPPSARAMSVEQRKTVDAGLDALYRCDYDGAEGLFSRAMSGHPGDPVYSLGYATSVWWRMENDFALPGSPMEKRFFAAIDRAIRDAKAATSGPDKASAYLYLGAAQGLRARREASERHWFYAYFDGRRSYKNERRAIRLSPQLYDAYLGLGAFDYYVATLSRLLRLLAFASGGDKSKGLAELHLAAQRGEFSRVAAKLLLVGIDWTFERDPQRAWDTLDEVYKLYPNSPMVESMRLIGLYRLRDAEGLKTAARAFLDKAEDGAPFFRPIDRAGGHYFLGLGEQLSGQYSEAIKQYEAAFKDAPEGQRMRGLLRLFIGECLDLQGHRAEAVDSYRLALRQPPLWGVPRYARYLLYRPYKATMDPLPPRNVALAAGGSD